MVFLEHRPRVYYNIILSYYNNTAIEATALFVQQQVKGAIIADLGAKMAAILDDCERTATVALPTAATSGFISGEVGISAALDAFSTVYELPLTRFKKGQTNKQTNRRTRTITIPRFTLRVTRGNKHTDMNDHYTSLYELRPREVTRGHDAVGPGGHFELESSRLSRTACCTNAASTDGRSSYITTYSYACKVTTNVQTHISRFTRV